MFRKNGFDGEETGNRYSERGAEAGSVLYAPPPYHSRAARDNRDGSSRYRGRKRRLHCSRKQGGTVEYVKYLTPDQDQG